MEDIILQVVNGVLQRLGIAPVAVEDKLHSSGLLSSIEMFEIILELESKGLRLKKGPDMSLPLVSIDSVEDISKQIEQCEL